MAVKLLRKSIRLKFTVWYIASIGVLFLLFSAIVFFRLEAFLVGHLDETLISGGKSLGDSLKKYRWDDTDNPQFLYKVASGDGVYIKEMDREVQEIFLVNVAFVQLTTCPEPSQDPPRILFKTANLKDGHLPLLSGGCQDLSPTPDQVTTVALAPSSPIRLVSFMARDYDDNHYILQVGGSLEEVRRVLKSVLLMACVLAPVMLVIFSLLGVYFVRKVFSPVREILALTRSITAEDLSKRLSLPHSEDEIGELSNTINQMIERLEHSFAQIEQFSADAAHELKTPLAKIRCNAEVALRKDRTKEGYQGVISALARDAEELETIVNDLLLLSGLDAKNARQSFEAFFLNDLVLGVFEALHQKAHGNHLVFDIDRLDAVKVHGDQRLIKTLVANLISNAVKYTLPGGRVSIDLSYRNHQAELKIRDTGIGIPARDLPCLFDRFYRVDGSRSLETGGSGLGLAIVRKITLLHQGQISVQSTEHQGSCFTVCLPALP